MILRDSYRCILDYGHGEHDDGRSVENVFEPPHFSDRFSMDPELIQRVERAYKSKMQRIKS